MPDPLAQISTRRTSQSEQADPRQVPNSAGGWTFSVPKMARLHRFLTLGTDGGTYYTSEAHAPNGRPRTLVSDHPESSLASSAPWKSCSGANYLGAALEDVRNT